MQPNYEEELLTAQLELEQIIKQMEARKEEFILATAAFIKTWYEEKAKQIVASNHEIIMSIDPNQLSTLKQQVANLEENALIITRKFMDIEDVWWHKTLPTTHPLVSYKMTGHCAPKPVDYALRLIAGAIAPIFQAHGFNEMAEWREYDKNGNYHPANARPYYVYHLDWSEELKRIINQYSDLQEQGAVLNRKLSSVKEAKAKDKAVDLWEHS